MTKRRGWRNKQPIPAPQRRLPVLKPSDGLERVFEPFLRANPTSSLVCERSDEGAPINLIRNPWGDKSISLTIPDDAAELAAVLNSLYLPPRLSALWHRDTRSLEVIWTAYELPESWKEVSNRRFNFHFQGFTRECEFSPSSARLMLIAKHLKHQSSSDTSFRNLLSFNMRENNNPIANRIFNFGEPLSFWVRPLDWEEDVVLELVNTLNFYMRYYDRSTPFILMHDVEEKTSKLKPIRYARGSFPRNVNARKLDPNIVNFVSTAATSNVFTSFILYHRAIEYASIHCVDEEARSQIRQLVIRPNVQDAPEDTVDAIIATLSAGSALDEITKFKRVIRLYVNIHSLWAVVKANIEFFSQDTMFDGGFTLSALVEKNESINQFSKHGLERFSDRIRKLRNAMVHGRDQETRFPLSPTTRNFDLLRPWTHLISIAATDIVHSAEM